MKEAVVNSHKEPCVQLEHDQSHTKVLDTLTHKGIIYKRIIIDVKNVFTA